MPVREFTGKLDAPKVREFTGQLDPPKQKPPGFTPLDLNAIFAKSRAGGYEPGFDPKVAGEVVADNTIDALPLIGGVAASFVPIPGSTAVGTIAGSALAAGIGAGAGEVARQIVRDDRDPAKLAKTAGGSAVGAGVATGALMVLGALAKRLFSFRPNQQMQQAIDFAKDQRVLFPLASAAPGSGPAKVQQAAETFLPSHMRTVSDAEKVTVYLNKTLAPIAAKGEVAVVDDAARKGQDFFARIINPNKAGTTDAWAAMEGALGGKVDVPLNQTMQAVRTARDTLKNAGASSGAKGDEFYTALDNFLANPSDLRTVKELNLFSGKVTKTGFKGPTASLARQIQDAIEADAVAIAKGVGMDDIAKQFSDGIANRAKYRELAKIPEIERLAGELGKGGRDATKGSLDWMNTLFNKGNGKALAKIREADPVLYHDLADAWLARQITQASTPKPGEMFTTIDGQKLRAWFTENQAKIGQFMTKEQMTALDNFSLYASYMSGAQAKAARGLGEKGMSLGRAGAEIAGVIHSPVLMGFGEGGAFVLARGLSDPSSRVFRAFTQGFSPSLRSFMLKSGALAGQLAGRAAVDGED